MRREGYEPLRPHEIKPNPWSADRWKEIALWQKEQRRKCWVPRITVEAVAAPRVWFCTFSFRGKAPSEREAVKSLQRYWKRVRKNRPAELNRRLLKDGIQLEPDQMPKIRYFSVLEYGEKKGRIHAHALVFCDASLHRRDLSRYWTKGICEIELVKDKHRAAGYVAKYVTKQKGRVMPSLGFGFVDFDMSLLFEGKLAYHNTFRKWIFRRFEQSGYPLPTPVNSTPLRKPEKRKTGMHKETGGQFLKGSLKEPFQYNPKIGNSEVAKAGLAQAALAVDPELLKAFVPEIKSVAEMALDALKKRYREALPDGHEPLEAAINRKKIQRRPVSGIIRRDRSDKKSEQVRKHREYVRIIREKGANIPKSAEADPYFFVAPF